MNQQDQRKARELLAELAAIETWDILGRCVFCHHEKPGHLLSCLTYRSWEFIDETKDEDGSEPQEGEGARLMALERRVEELEDRAEKIEQVLKPIEDKLMVLYFKNEAGLFNDTKERGGEARYPNMGGPPDGG